MAEITTPLNKQHTGVRKSRKLSTRVDLTPMVDLGFLLITFFIFTTTMALPKGLRIVLPAGNKADMPIGNSTALTVCPMADNRIFYFHGELAEALKENLYGVTTYSFTDGIGSIIRQKQLALDKSGLGRLELMLIIKPAETSIFHNTIDVLDEVLINAVSHYALTDITKEERQLLASQNIHL